MNKKIFIFMLLNVVILFSSCSFKNVKYLFYDDSMKADARMKQIIEAIKDNDKEGLKILFSKQALKESNDIDGSITDLFKFIHGDIKSWNQDSEISDESIEGDKKTTKIQSWFIVNTDNIKYKFFTVDYPIDMIHPNNQGLYTIRVVKAEDKDDSLQEAGVFTPKNE